MDSECHTPGQAFGGTEPLGLDIQIYISYKGNKPALIEVKVEYGV